MSIRNRILNILIALDQLLFSLLSLGSSCPDETFSAACWRWESHGLLKGKVLRPCIDFIFLHIFKDINHCKESYLSEKVGRQLPKEYTE